MRSLLLAFCLLVLHNGLGCQQAPKTSTDIPEIAASFGLAQVTGNYKRAMGSQSGGVQMGYESAVLYPDADDNELVLTWPHLADTLFADSAYFRLTLASNLKSRQRFYVYSMEEALIDSMDLSL